MSVALWLFIGAFCTAWGYGLGWFFAGRKYTRDLKREAKAYADATTKATERVEGFIEESIKREQELMEMKTDVLVYHEELNRKQEDLQKIEEAYLSILNSPYTRNVDRRAMQNLLYDTLDAAGVRYIDTSTGEDDDYDEDFGDPDPMSEFTPKKTDTGTN